MKVCSICNIEKNDSDYYKTTTSYCKTCQGLKYKEQRNAYRNTHKEKVKEWKKREYNKNRKQYLYTAAKSRAIDKGLDFDITLDDIIFPDICPILHIPIIIECGKGWRNPNSPAIDRIDNTKGYIKDNIQIISDRANVLKSDSTKEERILIYNFFKNLMKG